MIYLLLKKQALCFFPVKIVFAFVLFTSGPSAFAQSSKSSMAYRVAMPQPASQIYQVVFTYTRFKADMLELKMPAWTPGYYQLLHYAKQVGNFNATDGEGKTIEYNLLDYYDKASQLSSMARTTGYTCTASVNLLAKKMVTKKGVFPPELIGNDKACFDFVLNYLKERGVIWKKK